MHWKIWLPAMAAIGLCTGCGSSSPPIVKSNTTTTISASATKATTGGTISFSATVTQQAATGVGAKPNPSPSGTVSFVSGALTVGTANVGSGGMATLNITGLSSSQLALGSNTVTASYAGDTYNNPSQSPGSVAVAVIAGTTTNFSAAPTALEKGQVGNLVANITRNDATGAPTGSVTFSAGSQPLATVTLDDNGQAVLPVTSTALAIGNYSYGASYAGDSLDLASNGNATLAVIAPVSSPADVLTHHNNIARTGVQSAETALTPANVNASSFGKLYSFPVDGNLYAAPLWVGSLTMSDGKQHNVVFVATTNATVYAFDADNKNPSAGYLWKVSLLGSGEQAVAPADYNCNQPGPASGVIGTPVIDRSLGVLYVIGRSKSSGSSGTQYFQRLHALSIGSGIEVLNGPSTIAAQVKGTGDDSVNGVVAFNPLTQNQRAALLEAEGAVWIVWASHCDNAPYHGWTMAYDANDISQQIAVYNDTPNGSDGGIWMSAGGPSADGLGNIYTVSGNGTYDVNTGGEDYADTVNRLTFSGGTIGLADSFTPSNQTFLSQQDLDLGTSSPLLFDDPASSVAPQLLVTTDKSGRVYLMNRANLGKYDTGPKGQNADIEDFVLGLQVYGSLAYFNGRVYVAEAAGPMVAFTFTPGTATTAGTLQAQPSVSTNFTFAAGEAGGSQPVVSANGTNNGIIWGLNYKQATAVVYAFDPVTLAELWDSTQAANGRDLGAGPVSFTIPVIANGKVYVGNQKQLTVYGLLGQ
jgi:Bacterial Ig-like domain (group 3)/PQQ-like domain